MTKINELTRARREFLASDFNRGFVKFCGIKPKKIETGHFESEIIIRENHRTQDSFVHAGLIATMSDHTAGYAAFTVVAENIRILTVEFKINFLKPAIGKALHCKSEIISAGKQIIVAQSSVYDIRDTEEKMISRSTITLMPIREDKL